MTSSNATPAPAPTPEQIEQTLRYVKADAKKSSTLHGPNGCDQAWTMRPATEDEMKVLAGHYCRICLNRLTPKPAKPKPEPKPKAEKKPGQGEPRPGHSTEVKVSQVQPAPVTDVVADQKAKTEASLKAAKQPKRQAKKAAEQVAA